MTAGTAQRRRYRVPVIETFGPTIQGEGPAQGARCWFLRLGGCDYRCSWCDTMYAVDPAEVRANARKMGPGDIVGELNELGFDNGDLLIVSGGNPALHHLDALLDELAPWAAEVHVETQGTVFRPWLNRADLVVVSPKPPSSGMDEGGIEKALEFTAQLEAPFVYKFVAFDEADLDWAVAAVGALPYALVYLSAGTDQDADDMPAAVVERFRWLANRAVERDDLARFRVGLQAHVLVWPGERDR